jgi:hypothetical protein
LHRAALVAIARPPIQAAHPMTHHFDPRLSFTSGKDDLFHFLSYDDLFYTFGKDNQKTSNPIAILRGHAIHLYNGGHGDVSAGKIKLKDYSVTLYTRDFQGKKMILKTTRVPGKVRDNVKDAMATCTPVIIKTPMKIRMTPKQLAKAETVNGPTTNGAMRVALKPKQIARLVARQKNLGGATTWSQDKTLWVEAKVVPKNGETFPDDEEEEVAESVDTVTAEDESVDAPEDCGEASAVKGDEWNVVAVKDE